MALQAHTATFVFKREITLLNTNSPIQANLRQVWGFLIVLLSFVKVAAEYISLAAACLNKIVL
jgi:hypothetical protein